MRSINTRHILSIALWSLTMVGCAPVSNSSPVGESISSHSPGQAAFVTDWSKPAAKGSAGAWASKQEWRPGRITFVNDPSSPKGGLVARIEVDPGDKVGGWTGERAEFSWMQDAQGKPFPVTAASGHEFYAVSVKLSPDWQGPAPDTYNKSVWGIIFQLHGDDSLGSSPAIALCATDSFHLEMDTGDVLQGGKRTKPQGVTPHEFSNGSLNKGQWVEFMMDIVWASDSKGSITVYRRDQGGASWQNVFQLKNTPTLQYATGHPVGDHYWKTGYYRSGSPFKSVLFLGPSARGNSFDSVALAAFGQK